jgi:hypothetical protein
MPRKPLSIKVDDDLIAAIDEEVSTVQPQPSRIAMINHLLWQIINMRRSQAKAADWLYRMEYQDGKPWKDLNQNQQKKYLALARQMIEDVSRSD